jgi:acyl dehydratase
MPLTPESILALPPIESRHDLTKRDTIIYALGVGASELAFTYEERLEALPTMAMVMAYPGFIWRDLRYGVDWKRILHGESTLEIHKDLPVEGSFVGVTTLGPIFDKGADKGAICYQTRKIYDARGAHLATVGAAIFLRGDGGFGGSSTGQPKPHALPERAPDIQHSLGTSPTQALMYRMSGDLNPIHADPEIAKAAGFERPILHGLCTYAVAARSVLSALCSNRAASLKRFDVRFSSPVFPGETIRTDIWRDGEGRASFRSTVPERNVVVLDNGRAEYAS